MMNNKTEVSFTGNGFPDRELVIDLGGDLPFGMVTKQLEENSFVITYYKKWNNKHNLTVRYYDDNGMQQGVNGVQLGAEYSAPYIRKGGVYILEHTYHTRLIKLFNGCVTPILDLPNGQVIYDGQSLISRIHQPNIVEYVLARLHDKGGYEAHVEELLNVKHLKGISYDEKNCLMNNIKIR